MTQNNLKFINLDFLSSNGFLMEQEEAERLVGYPLPDRAFDWVPQGGRILIAKDPVPTMIGSIEIPQASREAESAGTGWIIGVGAMAGLLDDGRGLNIRSETSESLIGLHVSFGFHIGKVVRYSMYDSEYKSECLLLTPMDIWMIDRHPDPKAADAADEKRFLERKEALLVAEREKAAEERVEADGKLAEGRAEVIRIQEENLARQDEARSLRGPRILSE